MQYSIKDSIIELSDGMHIAVRRVIPVCENNFSPTLVFIHEGLGCIHMWNSFPEQLVSASGCPGLLYDRAGHGNSDPIREGPDYQYVQRSALEELPEVLSACSVSDPLLIGHSQGGSIALLYASRFPARAIITESAHIFMEVSLADDGVRHTIESWNAGRLKRFLKKYHGKKAKDVFSLWANTGRSSWFRDWSIEKDLSNVTCPALIIQGENDIFTTTEHAQSIAAGLGGPSNIILVMDCGHVPHLEQRDFVLKAMCNFITGSV